MPRMYEGLNAQKAVAVRRAAGGRTRRERELVGLRGGGNPMPEGLLPKFEMRFGRDFSRVRVHADAGAATLAHAMKAAALTIGSDIYFAPGRYDPGSVEGGRLLAHELAHTLQPAGDGVSKVGDPGEQAAERTASAFSRGEAMPAASDGGPRPGAIRCQQLPGTAAPPQSVPAVDLAENAQPLLAAAIGSMELSNFPTGQSAPTPEHLKQLEIFAATIATLLNTYTLSTITVTGHADTVGAEAANAALGQDRADAVAKALSGLGVPSIMTTESKGEGPAQAVSTKDNVADARNRRVEIHFLPRKSPLGPMGSQLVPPTLTRSNTKAPIDLRIHPRTVPDNGIHLPPDFYKPLPPPIKGTGPKSVLEIVNDKVEGLLTPVIDSVTRVLPEGRRKEAREWLKEKAKDAVEKGLPSLARSAAEGAGVTDSNELDMVEKSVEAAIKLKGGGTP